MFTYLGNLGVQLNKEVTPYVTYILFLSCTYLYFSGFGDAFYMASVLKQPFSIIGYQFTHANFSHLFGNSLYLLLFGPSVERYLGHLRFLLFYLLCGIGAALGYGLFYDNGMVGASGAIAGLLVAYPFAQKTLLGRAIAGIMCLVYFYLQFMETVNDFLNPILAGTAHLAHIAGGVVGLIILNIFNDK